MSIQQAHQASGIPLLIERIYNLELDNFLTGQVEKFSLDANWKTIIGQQGVKSISERLG